VAKQAASWRPGFQSSAAAGHRLSFTGNRFEIQSPGGKPRYVGTVRKDPSAKPAAIDFTHKEGVLGGKALMEFTSSAATR